MAQRLRRAEEGTAGEALRQFLDYWHSHGRRHFQSEEEILLPAYAGHGDPGHPLVVRVLVDHVDIRHRAQELERRSGPAPEMLRQLGSRLAEHVRLEERELFPLIEDALPAEELEAVASRLAELDFH